MFVAGNAFPLNILLKISDVATLEDERRQTNNELSKVPSEIVVSIGTTQSRKGGRDE